LPHVEEITDKSMQ